MKVVENTRKIISENGEYTVLAELAELKNHDGTSLYNLKFSTQWGDASDPHALQTKFGMFLNGDQLDRLRQLLV